jgi:hypothetical protein
MNYIIITMNNYNNIEKEHFLLLLDLKQDLVNEIQYYKSRLQTKEEQFKKIKKYLKDNCKHEFVSDYVSSGLDEMKFIEYCKHCEESK